MFPMAICSPTFAPASSVFTGTAPGFTGGIIFVSARLVAETPNARCSPQVAQRSLENISQASACICACRAAALRSARRVRSVAENGEGKATEFSICEHEKTDAPPQGVGRC